MKALTGDLYRLLKRKTGEKDNTMPNLSLESVARNGSALACLVLTSMLLCYPTMVSAQGRCWTSVGSAGTVDESNLANVDLTPTTAGIKGTVTNATVTIRYNVVAVDGLFGGEKTRLTVRFKDDSVTNARVLVSLNRLNIVNGQIFSPGGFDSNINTPPSGVFQTKERDFDMGFDFNDHAYYIVVELTKTGLGGDPRVQALKLCTFIG
jgi:hypothetical protein